MNSMALTLLPLYKEEQKLKSEIIYFKKTKGEKIDFITFWKLENINSKKRKHNLSHFQWIDFNEIFLFVWVLILVLSLENDGV